MDRVALAAEVSADPTGIGYAGQPEWRVADLLNEPRVPAKVKVPAFAARAFLLKTGAWAGVSMLADNTAAPTDVRGAAIIVRDTLIHTQQLDADEPDTLAAVEAMLGGLVAAGVLTDAQRTALLAMADGFVSRGAQLGLGHVTAEDVGQAMVEAGTQG